MPNSIVHISQAKTNLKLIEFLIDQKYWDWKVTICFYTALHLVNAHIAIMVNEHYRTHIDTLKAIDPQFNRPTKISQATYDSYRSLQNLSRIARYLSKNTTKTDDTAVMIYDKHYAKAIRMLNKVIDYFSIKYTDVEMPKIKIKCADLKNNQDCKRFNLVS